MGRPGESSSYGATECYGHNTTTELVRRAAARSDGPRRDGDGPGDASRSLSAGSRCSVRLRRCSALPCADHDAGSREIKYGDVFLVRLRRVVLAAGGE